VSALSEVVSLRCPLSGARIKTLAHFASVDTMDVFDLDTFMQHVQRSGKWQCPRTMANCCVYDLRVDAFMEGVLRELSGGGEQGSRAREECKAMEVEVTSGTQWYAMVRGNKRRK
jgi:hypothetical protein